MGVGCSGSGGSGGWDRGWVVWGANQWALM